MGVERVHIVFAIRRLMHQAGAFRSVDVVGGQDLVGVRTRCAAFRRCLFGREIREDRVVAPAHHVGALELTHHLIVLAELLVVGAEQGLGEVEFLAGELAFLGAHLHIVDVCTHHNREVRGHGPRRGGPEHRIGVVFVAQLHRDRYGRVLTVLVHVGVHAQLVRGQRRLVLRAVRQHAVALVCQAFLVQRLERPHDRLHVRDVECLVAVFKIDPARLAVHIVTPFVHVFEHGGAAGVVEFVDAHLLDLVDRVDAELLLRFKFGGQAVRVPAEHAVDAPALHGLVARHHVFGVAGEQMAVVRQSVRKGRAVEEHERIRAVLAAGVFVDGFLEGAVGVPITQHILFELREVGIRRDVRALFADRCLGIHVLWCFAHHCSSSCRICLFLRGRWLRADCLPTPAPPRYHLACHAGVHARVTACVRLYGPTPSVLLGRAAPRPAVLPKAPR